MKCSSKKTSSISIIFFYLPLGITNIRYWPWCGYTGICCQIDKSDRSDRITEKQGTKITGFFTNVIAKCEKIAKTSLILTSGQKFQQLTFRMVSWSWRIRINQLFRWPKSSSTFSLVSWRKTCLNYLFSSITIW